MIARTTGARYGTSIITVAMIEPAPAVDDCPSCVAFTLKLHLVMRGLPLFSPGRLQCVQARERASKSSIFPR